jgi:hypothetical protein
MFLSVFYQIKKIASRKLSCDKVIKMQKTNAKKCLSDSPSQKNATTERMFSELPAEDARHGIRFGTHAFFPQPRRLF